MRGNVTRGMWIMTLFLIFGCATGFAAQKEWTVMVYCAADNDLAPFGLIDINEMELVGSTDDVDVIVQFDGSEQHSPEAVGSCRYHIAKDDDMDTITSPVVEDLGEVDMGSKSTLLEFLRWGVSTYPAKKYMVVLWNHGNGWYQSADAMPLDFTSPKDVQDIIDAIEQIQGGGREELNKIIASRRLQNLVRPGTSLRPFAPAPGAGSFGGDRAIAIDEGNGTATALSTTDIREAMAEIRSSLMDGQRFEVIGFDACLMGMVEVMHELRADARWGIGSMKTEPGDGWPYDKFLAKLVANPGMDGKALGTVVVDEYTEHYRRTNAMAVNPFHKANCTQAVVDMDKIADLADSLGLFGTTLIDPALRELLWQVVINTQHCGEIARTEPTVLIQLTAHRDIVHFAQIIKAVIDKSGADQARVAMIKAYADDVIAKHDAAVVHFKKLTASPLMGIANAHGLSVMIPFLKIEGDYKEVEFGRSPWVDFMKFFKATPEEAQALIAIMTGQAGAQGEGEAAEAQRKRFSNLYEE